MNNQFVTKPIPYHNMVDPLSICEDVLVLLVPTANREQPRGEPQITVVEVKLVKS